MSPNDDLLYFNGINGSTGDYLVPPMAAESVVQVARGETFAPEHLMELKWRQAQKQAHYGVKEGIDPTDLAQAGWGVIFAQGADPAIRDALAELLDHRQAQANRVQDRYHEYSGTNGYRPNESKNMFLARQGAGPGPVDPDKVPYYLLIVGDPETIPYAFQFQLDVAYGVGRIHFDTVDEYAQYAHSVVTAETHPQGRARRAAFFAAANPDDPSTQQSAEYLVKPLTAKLQASQPAWSLDTYIGESATKSRLESLLGKDETPALVFTASHGVGFDLGDPRQLKQQGALVCQDWTGPAATRGRPVPQTMYYAADDVASDAHVFGMVGFHFACFGGGTPRFDEFSHLRQGIRERAQIAPVSFLAKLPKRLLAHPQGGALAVIAHVDRAWGSSFLWNKNIEQLTVFESALTRLMQGHPVGSATEYFNERYAELATSLSGELEDIKYGKKSDSNELAALWTANNDARGYAVIGDPAVRLMVTDENTFAQPQVELIQLSRATNGSAPSAVTIAPSTNGKHAETGALAQAIGALSKTVQTMAQAGADNQPIEITTAQGDARLISKVHTDGSVTTIVHGIIGEPLLNIHTRLVEQAQRHQLETIQAVVAAAQILAQLQNPVTIDE